MLEVPVEVGERRYEVLVGPGVRGDLPAVLAGLTGGAPSQAAVVTEAALVDQQWFAGIDPGVASEVHVVPGSEEGKTPRAVTDLCRAMARQGLSRRDVVVAVGGGVVTDLAGFAAATYLRGVRYVNVATTLLAQVDAAIGGKTGANLPEGKNLVGAFWQPSAVLCDTEVLTTLPARELDCGRGEMAKYAFLSGGPPDTTLLTLPVEQQVARCVALKAEVVAADEREGGRRALLNYGHTLAHALEAAQLEQARLDEAPPGSARGAGLRHGEAVAVGLVFAAHLARRLGRIDEARVALHRRVVEGFGLSAELPPDVDPAVLLTYMARDKKADHDLTFVLDGPNGPEVVSDVHPEEVLATLARMQEAPS